MNENSGSGSSKSGEDSKSHIRSVLSFGFLRRMHQKHLDEHEGIRQREERTKSLIAAVLRHPSSNLNVIVLPVKEELSGNDLSLAAEGETTDVAKVIPFPGLNDDHNTPPSIA